MSGSGGFTVFIPVANGYAPKQGPLAAPLDIDWTTDTQQEFDMVEASQNGAMEMVQHVWIDNNDVNQAVTFTVGGTGQRIKAPANSQGSYQVISGMPFRFTASIPATEEHKTKCLFLNMPQPIGVWGP